MDVEYNSNPENRILSETSTSLDNENNTAVAETLSRVPSSHNVFVELPITNEGTCRSAETADTLSDSDDSIIFCSDPDVAFQSSHMEKPKDILAEVSDILMSLSDDERFTECMNYSNNNNIINGSHEIRRSSVDLIFTYNVLNILYSKLRELKVYFEIIKSENNKLIKESHISEAEHLAYQVQVEALQKLVDEQKEKISGIQTESRNQEKEKKQLENELKSLRKKCEEAVSEKDAAVMRYVKNESELIGLRKEKEYLTKRIKNVENERDDLAMKVKNLNSEKTSISHTLDSKKAELYNAVKDIEKLKEELNCKDIKSKWIEENLQKTLNRYKEQNAGLQARLEELRIHRENHENCQGKDKHNDDLCTETGCGQTVTSRDESLMNENNLLASKVQKLENERLECEKNLMCLKQSNEMQNQKISMLEEQLIEMETLRVILKQMQDELTSYKDEVNRLKEMNDELRQDMDSCREREAEMLNFTEKLTAKNVILQSENAIVEAKKTALEADRLPIEKQVKELEDKMASLTQLLDNEIKSRAEDVERLTQQFDNKVKEIDELNSKLEEQQAENQSLKHKYSSTMRELTKEVQQYRKYKQYDAECSSSGDSACLESRTSSCNSLNEPPQLPKLEPDRQTLIERIVKLQKINAKHSEKIEFLEEHISQLLTEMKKKNRVIQHYVLREQSGVLSSYSMDQNKAELSKYGGIMASLYNPKCENNTLSLELSLEINRKLQAVLEDTILKNITLKDSIETLGKEIEKLTNANPSNKH